MSKAASKKLKADDAQVEDVSCDTDEELEVSYISIDCLQEEGINAADINKLKEAHIATVGQLFQISQKRLLQVKGISDSKLEKILQGASKLLGDRGGFTSANSLFERLHERFHITTGSKQLDAILGGGIESKTVTEIHGEFRTGKTQLCHTLCVTCQLPRSQGGAAGKVAYIDTEGTFRPQRVAEIASGRYNLNQDEVLDNIIVARAYSHDTQIEMAVKLGSLLADPERGPFRVLIVDSVTALFRTDFKGRGELGERQQRLNEHLSLLVKHAEEFNIAVLLVNQVMADPGAASMFGPVMRPIGGHVLAHAVHTRVLMKKGREDSRICKVIDSPNMPEAEAMIRLASGGVTDVDD